MFYKKIAATLSIIILLSVFNITAYAELNNKWYDTAVEQWINSGLIKGYPDGNINPESKMTRAEFFSIVNRVLNLSYKNLDNVFIDINKSDWYYNDIITAYYCGFVKGSEKNGILYANPNNFITREEAVSVLYRCFSIDKLKKTYNPVFKDYTDVSEYAKNAVNAFAGLGYINGYGDGSFKPKENLSRVQMIILISGIAGRIDNKLDDFINIGNYTVSNDTSFESTVNGNTYIITYNDIKLTNLKTDGTVIIKNLADKNINIKLNNCEIGSLIADKSPNNGKLTLTSEKSKIYQTDIYNDTDFVSKDNTNFSKIYLLGNMINCLFDGNFDEITAVEGSNIDIAGESNISSININKTSTLYVSSNSFVNNIVVAENAKNSNIIYEDEETEISTSNIKKSGSSHSTHKNNSDTSTEITTEIITEITTETVIETTTEISLSVDAAYILKGKLYVIGNNYSKLPEKIEVRRLIDSKGKIETVIYTNVKMSGITTKEGFDEYCLYSENNMILFDDGKYSIYLEGKEYPIVSVLNYRVPDTSKKTKNASQQLDGKTIAFNDNVYPIVFNSEAYNSIKFNFQATDNSINNDKWPEILKTGIRETNVNASGTSVSIDIAYPKDKNKNQPIVYNDTIPNDFNSAYSLDHMDKMTLTINNLEAYTLYWDQISKLWYEENTVSDKVDMVYVEGGEFKRGDWRSEGVYAYQYGTSTPMNIKKLWLNCLDPQFMGEDEIGKEAVGKTGLLIENSSTKDEKSSMWLINDDATRIHNVRVSDFEIGKYEVTMDQFYKFVDDVNITSPSALYYNTSNSNHVLNDIASRSVYAKKQYRRDNGWGFGSRPAMDINWYEATEFCNWLSIREGLEPVYTFTNIYKGKKQDGLTDVLLLPDKPDSIMGKMKITKQKVQLCSIACDFNKNGYRLPTEAEFEYAARGGKYISKYNDGNGYLYSGINGESTKNNIYYSWQRTNVDNPQISGLSEGNLYDNNMGGNGYSNPVGARLPNALGIHDLTGNVWETTWDFFSFSYYGKLAGKSSIAVNPIGPEYSIEQKSIINGYPVDEYMANEYMYNYKENDNGNSTRISAVPVSSAGKFAHTLRGGCFTNPYPLTATVNRYSPGQTFVNNCINFTDARVGFRLARSVTDNAIKEANQYNLNKAKNTLLKAFGHFKSTEYMDIEQISKLYDFNNLLIMYPFGEISTKDDFLNWVKNISENKLNTYQFNSIKLEYVGNSVYKAQMDITYIEQNKLTGELVSSQNYIYDMTLTDNEKDEYMKINQQIVNYAMGE